MQGARPGLVWTLPITGVLSAECNEPADRREAQRRLVMIGEHGPGVRSDADPGVGRMTASEGAGMRQHGSSKPARDVRCIGSKEARGVASPQILIAGMSIGE